MSSVTYDREVLTTVLAHHWPTASSGCRCGWAVLGASFPEHVADVYEQSVAVRTACPDCDGTGCPYCGGPEADYHTSCVVCQCRRGDKRTQEVRMTNEMAEQTEGMEIAEGYVWCDHYGAIHDDDPNPYDEGHWRENSPRKGLRTWVEFECPGTHKKVLIDQYGEGAP